MEKFTTFEKILVPDERNSRWGVTNTATGETRLITLEDHYKRISEILVESSVPEDVRSQFNVAKNLAVYAWHSYSFHQVSEMKAFSTVEYALKDRLNKRSWSFKKLIEKSVRWELIKDSGFSHVESLGDGNPYSRSLPEIMPKLRNNLAHGSTTLHPGSIFTLQMCSEFINQLYKNKLNKESQQDSVVPPV